MHLCEKHGLLSDNSVRVVGKTASCFIAQIPYRMVKCQAISHPVRNLKTGDHRYERSAFVSLSRRSLLRQGGLLGFFLVLVVVPRTDSRVDEASEEEDEADKQYDPDHATVKSVSFA
ncbi:Uncharacterised protein [Citrobacter youngae]|uniref:Uncharacterized protein n=1 Tax=Citrobacter youngae TaxID=133448 RepID=A0A9Q8E8K8_9ENTR|nr:Uncharacterised protein [Citrobacter youngae]